MIELANDLDRPAVLFLDLDLGGQVGTSVLKKMRTRTRHPIVTVYVSGNAEAKAQALAAGGAIAYEVKPMDPEVVRAYVEVVAPEQIDIALKATRDRLTGLLNRGGFFQFAAMELNRAVRNKTSTASIFVDIDDFKFVNDTYGHGAGDQMIAEVARCIKEDEHLVRVTDIVGRRGGDEFVVLLPATTYDQAKMVAERLEHAVGKAHIKSVDGRSISVTVSTGVLTLEYTGISTDREETLEDLLGHSSLIMKEAKERNKARRGKL
jgi:diguanylate cyclase (GGDEF)-like protein